jgi:hypothetical protein
VKEEDLFEVMESKLKYIKDNQTKINLNFRPEILRTEIIGVFFAAIKREKDAN